LASPNASLATALGAIDWKKNVQHVLSKPDIVQAFDSGALRIATWSRQFENTDKGNAALCFVRDMQISAQYTATCAALALYKPAASTMRAMFESALYYTYFRSHLSELRTLAKGSGYYMDKSELIEYHKQHTEGFSTNEQQLGLLQQMKTWYAKISSVIHGQLPGEWVAHTALSDLKHNDKMLANVVDRFKVAEELTHKLFLCTAGQELWNGFSTAAKQSLCKGLSAAVRGKLGLDLA
jgi:hypothetical protein